MTVDTEGKINGFLTAFPDTEHRYAAAVQLAGPTTEKLPHESYLSWDFLAAHWGDSEDELRALGDFIWNLYDDLPSEPKPVAIFKRGSFTELKAPEPQLEKPIHLITGVVKQKELVHGFTGNLGQKALTRLGHVHPYLAFGLRLRLRNALEIDADIVGEPVTTRLAGNYQDVAIYFGAVTLEADLQSYQNSRTIKRRDMVMGRRACREIEDLLRAKTGAFQSTAK